MVFEYINGVRTKDYIKLINNGILSIKSNNIENNKIFEKKDIIFYLKNKNRQVQNFFHLNEIIKIIITFQIIHL